MTQTYSSTAGVNNLRTAIALPAFFVALTAYRTLFTKAHHFELIG
jgi:hypothetical protein